VSVFRNHHTGGNGLGFGCPFSFLSNNKRWGKQMGEAWCPEGAKNRGASWVGEIRTEVWRPLGAERPVENRVPTIQYHNPGEPNGKVLGWRTAGKGVSVQETKSGRS
jgi:hypothetical protein